MWDTQWQTILDLECLGALDPTELVLHMLQRPI